MVDASPKRMSPLDRISDLPESIISDILSSLPTKDAVATSILSRSWRFRWTRITSFDFKNPKKHTYRDEEAAPTLDFSDFVNMVLLKHCGESINKFVLHWSSPHFRPAYLNTWVNIAIARNVRVLDLNPQRALGSIMSLSQGKFHLPLSLYTSGTLEVLRLKGRFLIKPPNKVCLPKLAEIKLFLVMYESDESLPVLISGCPFLESLEIKRYEESDNMVVCSISCPTLKRLLISFDCGHYFRIHNVDLELKIDAPALEILDLADRMSRQFSIQPRLSSVNRVSLDVMCSDQNVVEFLQSLGSVKFLTIIENRTGLSGRMLSVSFQGVATFRFSSPLSWRCMMDVIDSCINLEKLELWCLGIFKRAGFVPRRLSGLRCLTFRYFTGDRMEMKMLKFFVEHSLVMETVHLSFCEFRPLDDSKKAEILNEVSKWSKASPACEISWHEISYYSSCFDE